MVAFLLMQGKNFPQIVAVLGVGFALLFPNGTILRAYDAPNFDASIFERDGLSIAAPELNSAVASLVAVASNPDSDSDLKEKAIGVALQLDPLNPAARKVNETLLLGALPAPVTDLDAATAAENLWKVGHGLLKSKPSPDDAKLAPYLMEIALVFHPAPPADLIWQFGEITEKKALNWKKFVTLQPDENSSGRQISKLFASLESPATPEVTPPAAMDTPPATTDTPEMTTTTIADDVPISPVKISSGKIAAVFHTSEGPVAAIVMLDIRDPNTDEASLFSVFAPDGSERGTFEMKIRSKSGLPVALSGLEGAAEKVKRRYPRWPDKKIAELSVTTPAGGTLRVSGVEELDTAVVASLLLDQAFSGDEILDDFVYIEPSKTPLKAISEAMVFEKSKAVIPSVLYPSLLQEVAVNDDGGALSKVQLIEAKGAKEALAILQGKSDMPIVESLVEFDAIVAKKPAAMTVVEFSKAATVATVLTEFSAKYPFHMSAKIMANLGETTSSPEFILKRAISSIDAVMKPFASVYADAVSPEGGGVQQDLSRDFRDAGSTFSKLRTEIPASSSAYLKLAEKVMDRMEVFLSLNNRTSSIGEQRHRELKEAIVELNAERERLGLGPLGG